MKKIALAIGLTLACSVPSFANSIGGIPTHNGVASSLNQNLPTREDTFYQGKAVTSDGAPIKIQFIAVYTTTLRSAGLRSKNAVDESIDTAFKRVTKNSTVPEIKSDPQKFINRVIWVSEYELKQKIRGVAGIEKFDNIEISDDV